MKHPKNSEAKYRKQLNALIDKLREDVTANIVPLIRQLQPEYVNDVYVKTLEDVFSALCSVHFNSDADNMIINKSTIKDAYAKILENAFNNLRDFYSNINKNAQFIANSFVESTDKTNKQRFNASLEDATGVNLQTVLNDEGLEDILLANTRENVSLIRSIPEEYLKSIETVVFSGTMQGNTAGSMIAQISKIGGVTRNRAKLIARDQTSKLNSALTQQRSQNLGVKEYVWRTAGDDRVRESHKSKNGKVFSWDDPPKDTGHPGQDIQCRCVAQPIIKI